MFHRTTLPLLALTIVLALVSVVSGTEEGKSQPGLSYKVHLVQQGETLFTISKQYGWSVSELAEINGLADPNVLAAGQELLVPSQPESETAKLMSLIRERKARFEQYSDQTLIAMIIEAEAGSEPFEGKVAVGAVILNRVEDSGFPATVLDVIIQPGQFLSVENGQVPCNPSRSSLNAAERSLSGEDPTERALYFYNPEKTSTPEWWSKRPVIKVIANHAFAI